MGIELHSLLEKKSVAENLHLIYTFTKNERLLEPARLPLMSFVVTEQQFVDRFILHCLNSGSLIFILPVFFVLGTGFASERYRTKHW